jgi:hypothetical protein
LENLPHEEFFDLVAELWLGCTGPRRTRRQTIYYLAITRKGLSELHPLVPKTFTEWMKNLAHGISDRVKTLNLAESYLQRQEHRGVLIQVPPEGGKSCGRGRDASSYPTRDFRDYRSRSRESHNSRSRSRDRDASHSNRRDNEANAAT